MVQDAHNNQAQGAAAYQSPEQAEIQRLQAENQTLKTQLRQYQAIMAEHGIRVVTGIGNNQPGTDGQAGLRNHVPGGYPTFDPTPFQGQQSLPSIHNALPANAFTSRSGDDSGFNNKGSEPLPAAAAQGDIPLVAAGAPIKRPASAYANHTMARHIKRARSDASKPPVVKQAGSIHNSSVPPSIIGGVDPFLGAILNSPLPIKRQSASSMLFPPPASNNAYQPGPGPQQSTTDDNCIDPRLLTYSHEGLDALTPNLSAGDILPPAKDNNAGDANTTVDTSKQDGPMGPGHLELPHPVAPTAAKGSADTASALRSTITNPFGMVDYSGLPPRNGGNVRATDLIAGILSQQNTAEPIISQPMADPRHQVFDPMHPVGEPFYPSDQAQAGDAFNGAFAPEAPLHAQESIDSPGFFDLPVDNGVPGQTTQASSNAAVSEHPSEAGSQSSEDNITVATGPAPPQAAAPASAAASASAHPVPAQDFLNLTTSFITASQMAKKTRFRKSKSSASADIPNRPWVFGYTFSDPALGNQYALYALNCPGKGCGVTFLHPLLHNRAIDHIRAHRGPVADEDELVRQYGCQGKSDPCLVLFGFRC